MVVDNELSHDVNPFNSSSSKDDPPVNDFNEQEPVPVDTTNKEDSVNLATDKPVIEMTPEQALNALHEEHKTAMEYITRLESTNDNLKSTVNQLETQINTG